MVQDIRLMIMAKVMADGFLCQRESPEDVMTVLQACAAEPPQVKAEHNEWETRLLAQHRSILYGGTRTTDSHLNLLFPLLRQSLEKTEQGKTTVRNHADLSALMMTIAQGWKIDEVEVRIRSITDVTQESPFHKKVALALIDPATFSLLPRLIVEIKLPVRKARALGIGNPTSRTEWAILHEAACWPGRLLPGINFEASILNMHPSQVKRDQPIGIDQLSVVIRGATITGEQEIYRQVGINRGDPTDQLIGFQPTAELSGNESRALGRQHQRAVTLSLEPLFLDDVGFEVSGEVFRAHDTHVHGMVKALTKPVDRLLIIAGMSHFLRRVPQVKWPGLCNRAYFMRDFTPRIIPKDGGSFSYFIAHDLDKAFSELNPVETDTEDAMLMGSARVQAHFKAVKAEVLTDLEAEFANNQLVLDKIARLRRQYSKT